MNRSETNYEDIVVEVEKIASVLGISLSGLPAIELFAVQVYISGVLGGNTEIAEKIIKLAIRKAEGKNPQKEITKLQKKVTSLHLPRQTAPTSLETEASLRENPPFDRRTELARKRLPKTGGFYAKWSVGTIFRGPRKIKRK